MEHYKVRILNRATVAIPSRQKPDAQTTPKSKAESKKNKVVKKTVNNEEGD
jgi:hypothetical protein